MREVMLACDAPMIALQARCDSRGTSQTSSRTKTMHEQLEAHHEAAARAAMSSLGPNPCYSKPQTRCDSCNTSETCNTKKIELSMTGNPPCGRSPSYSPPPRLWYASHRASLGRVVTRPAHERPTTQQEQCVKD